MKASLAVAGLSVLFSAILAAACVPIASAPAATAPAPTTQAVPSVAPAAMPPTTAPTTPATAGAAGLPLAALKGAEYPSEVVSGGKVTLSDGSYEGPGAPGSASKISVKLLDQWVAAGDLNADGVPDAAVILVESGGGTGSFYELATVLNAGGRPDVVAAAALGDRVRINAVTIQDGEITVDMIAHGPQDPLCCPTLAVTQKYRLEGGKLVQTSPVPAAEATPGTAVAAYSDPFAYCAAVGTIDAPDSRYVGPKVSPAVAAGLMQALNLPAGTPPPPIAQNSTWRCMAGKVYACTVGANLPCGEKGNTDRQPTQPMQDFCQANPNSDFIPMAVTGRATVYSWRCQNGAAVVDKQTTEIDARGFLANVWYQINP